jgi:hypothetical protein
MARNYNDGEPLSMTVTTVVNAPVGCEPTALPAGRFVFSVSITPI